MKRLATVSTLTLVLVSCSAATMADTPVISQTSQSFLSNTRQVSSVIGYAKTQTFLEKQAEIAFIEKLNEMEKQKALIANEEAIKHQISELKNHVGKTWYVFSGSQPSGWDCSGMTRWFYGELGIDIPHSASKQGNTVGWHVETPKPGDIVAFSHMNSEKYYHVGIYIGNNKIIHAGFRKGTKTEIISLDSPSFKNSEISFVRVINN